MNASHQAHSCSSAGASGHTSVCRMIRWCTALEDAERELNRLLRDGWSGTLIESTECWQVVVVRPLRRAVP